MPLHENAIHTPVSVGTVCSRAMLLFVRRMGGRHPRPRYPARFRTPGNTVSPAKKPEQEWGEVP